MSDVVVRHESGDRFRIDIRGHRLVVDQPTDAGGGDAGATPTELFAASLASCVAFYAERYLRRHGLPVDGLEVGCGFSMSKERPARVTTMELEVTLPAPLTDSQRRGLLAVVEHCTVHNSIRQAPDVRISLGPSRMAA